MLDACKNTPESHYSGHAHSGAFQCEISYDAKEGEEMEYIHARMRAQADQLLTIAAKHAPKGSRIKLDMNEERVMVEGDPKATEVVQREFSKIFPKLKGLKFVALDKRVSDLFKHKDLEPKGVEPKFVSHKGWTKKDDDNLFKNPDHKFYKKAQTFLRENQEIFGYMGKIDAENPDNNNAAIKVVVREHIRETEPKFQKRHFVKLDYTKEKGGTAVRREKVRAMNLVKKIPLVFRAMVAKIYLKNTEATVKETNFGAVRECLANEIYTVLGFGNVKVKIIEDKYDDGMPKLYLDSTEARGPKSEKPHGFAASIFKGIPRSKSVDGRFKENKVEVDGKWVSLDTASLAKGLGPALLMGDYDAWGSKGDNMLFYVSADDGMARLLNIDPGKALSPTRTGATDWAKERNISSNAAWIPSPVTAMDKFYGGYKNFTLFMDTTLSERMEGIKPILDDENWKKVEALFDQYIDYYGKGRGEDLNFAKELTELKEKLGLRRKYFLEVFKDRKNLSAPELDLVENLEKLTSPVRTDAWVGASKREAEKTELVHMEVIPDTRKEWNLIEKDGKCYLICRPSEDREGIRKTLQEFLKVKGPFEIEETDEGIRIPIDRSKATELLEGIFSEENIRAFKTA